MYLAVLLKTCNTIRDNFSSFFWRAAGSIPGSGRCTHARFEPHHQCITVGPGECQRTGDVDHRAVQSAVDYHPQVSSNRNSKLSADEDVKFARGGYYPSVDLVAGYGRQRSDNATTRAEGNHNKETLNYTQSELRLRQMIFDGFNTANEVGRTEAVSTSRATTPSRCPGCCPACDRGVPGSAQAPRAGDPGQEQPASPPARQRPDRPA